MPQIEEIDDDDVDQFLSHAQGAAEASSRRGRVQRGAAADMGDDEGAHGRGAKGAAAPQSSTKRKQQHVRDSDDEVDNDDDDGDEYEDDDDDDDDDGGASDEGSPEPRARGRTAVRQMPETDEDSDDEEEEDEDDDDGDDEEEDDDGDEDDDDDDDSPPDLVDLPQEGSRGRPSRRAETAADDSDDDDDSEEDDDSEDVDMPDLVEPEQPAIPARMDDKDVDSDDEDMPDLVESAPRTKANNDDDNSAGLAAARRKRYRHGQIIDPMDRMWSSEGCCLVPFLHDLGICSFPEVDALRTNLRRRKELQAELIQIEAAAADVEVQVMGVIDSEIDKELVKKADQLWDRAKELKERTIPAVIKEIMRLDVVLGVIIRQKHEAIAAKLGRRRDGTYYSKQEQEDNRRRQRARDYNRKKSRQWSEIENNADADLDALAEIDQARRVLMDIKSRHAYIILNDHRKYLAGRKAPVFKHIEEGQDSEKTERKARIQEATLMRKEKQSALIRGRYMMSRMKAGEWPAQPTCPIVSIETRGLSRTFNVLWTCSYAEQRRVSGYEVSMRIEGGDWKPIYTGGNTYCSFDSPESGILQIRVRAKNEMGWSLDSVPRDLLIQPIEIVKGGKATKGKATNFVAATKSFASAAIPEVVERLRSRLDSAKSVSDVHERLKVIAEILSAAERASAPHDVIKEIRAAEALADEHIKKEARQLASQWRTKLAAGVQEVFMTPDYEVLTSSNLSEILENLSKTVDTDPLPPAIRNQVSQAVAGLVSKRPTKLISMVSKNGTVFTPKLQCLIRIGAVVEAYALAIEAKALNSGLAAEAARWVSDINKEIDRARAREDERADVLRREEEERLEREARNRAEKERKEKERLEAEQRRREAFEAEQRTLMLKRLEEERIEAEARAAAQLAEKVAREAREAEAQQQRRLKQESEAFAAAAAAKTVSSDNHVSQQRRVCKFYNTKEGCARGSKCTFAHVDGGRGKQSSRQGRTTPGGEEKQGQPRAPRIDAEAGATSGLGNKEDVATQPTVAPTPAMVPPPPAVVQAPIERRSPPRVAAQSKPSVKAPVNFFAAQTEDFDRSPVAAAKVPQQPAKPAAADASRVVPEAPSLHATNGIPRQQHHQQQYQQHQIREQQQQHQQPAHAPAPVTTRNGLSEPSRRVSAPPTVSSGKPTVQFDAVPAPVVNTAAAAQPVPAVAPAAAPKKERKEKKVKPSTPIITPTTAESDVKDRKPNGAPAAAPLQVNITRRESVSDINQTNSKPQPADGGPTERPRRERAPRPPPVCRFFNTKEGCRQGDQCTFRHVEPHANGGDRPPVAQLARGESWADDVEEQQPVPSAAPTQRLPRRVPQKPRVSSGDAFAKIGEKLDLPKHVVESLRKSFEASRLPFLTEHDLDGAGLRSAALKKKFIAAAQLAD